MTEPNQFTATFQSMVDDYGGLKPVAALLGVSKSTVSNWASHTRPNSHVPAWAFSYLKGVLGQIRSHESMTLCDRLHHLADEAGGCHRVWVRAKQDGTVTPREKREMYRQVMNLEREVEGLKHDLGNGMDTPLTLVK